MAATSNTSLRVADLDFNSIRNNLKTFLNGQTEFTDYDFEGSSLAVLLDLLAYNTYYNSFYLNMAANEAFLDTAQIRQNILSHAKAINYVPQSSLGAKSVVNITVTPTGTEDPTKQILTLSPYTRMIGADIRGINYPFVTVNSNTAYKSGSSFGFANVYIQQGDVVTQQFLMTSNNTLARFELPSANIDTTSLIVTVQASTANTYTEPYALSQDITNVTGNSRIYFVEENENLNYTLQFGDGVLGYRPPVNSVVIATYIDTQGAVANNVSVFKFIDPVGGVYSGNVIVSTVQKAFGGSDKETIDQIRYRAPQSYTAQNRCVTVNDYESLIIKDFSNIDSVSVWGGESNDPPVYGKVYISLKTKNYYSLSNLEKTNITNYLIANRNIITVQPELVDPEYIFLLIRGQITYNPTLTTKSVGDLFNIAKQAIFQYNEDQLNTFNSTFRKSKLQYYLENADPAFTGSDITVYLQSRINISTTLPTSYKINFNTPLKKGSYSEKIFTYPYISVADSVGVYRNIYYEEVPESFTGVDSINIINPGINYNSANVSIDGDGTGATAVATVVNGQIQSIQVTNKGSGYSRASVNIDGNGVNGSALAILQAKNGILRTYYFDNNGNKIYVNTTAGTVDYNSGQVVLSSVIPSLVGQNNYYDTNVMTFNAVPDSQIIPPLRNRILAIDENNFQSVQLDMIAET